MATAAVGPPSGRREDGRLGREQLAERTVRRGPSGSEVREGLPLWSDFPGQTPKRPQKPEGPASTTSSRHCLIIICSGIPRRTPRGSWPCNGWLSSRTGLPGAAAPSGGRHSARPYFGRGTSGHRRSADAPDRLGCFHVPGSLTRCLCPRTTAGSNRHRRPGRQRLPRGVSEAVLKVEGPTPRPSDW